MNVCKSRTGVRSYQGERQQQLRRPLLGKLFPLRRANLCRADTDSDTDSETSKALKEGVLSEDEIRKLATLRRQQQQQREAAASKNFVQGAVEEAQLITWPKPQKAFLDTILVLGIVIGSGSLLLGVNVILANASELWYHRG